jgi:hypothetical protein
VTEQERQEAKERLAAGLAAYKAIPESQKTPVRDPGKYAFPVGLDDDGVPFPLPDEGDQGQLRRDEGSGALD